MFRFICTGFGGICFAFFRRFHLRGYCICLLGLGGEFRLRGFCCFVNRFDDFRLLSFLGANIRVDLGDLYTDSGQTLQGSFSTVSKPNFASKY